MNDTILSLFSAFVGSLGFTLLFRVRKRYWFAASLGGMLGWAVYLLIDLLSGDLFISTLLAAAFGAFYAEILSRILKAPATIFMVPAVVPLIPGSGLYYTMVSIVSQDSAAAASYGRLTALSALAIAGGMSLVWALWIMLAPKPPKKKI